MNYTEYPSLKQMPTEPRPQGVICVVRRSDVTVCEVIQWKLWAPLGHLFCPHKLWNSLIILISLWRISIICHESCPWKSCVCSAQAGACLIVGNKRVSLGKDTHVRVSYTRCVSALVRLQHWWFTAMTLIWHVKFPKYSHLHPTRIFQAAENTLCFLVWETLLPAGLLIWLSINEWKLT